MDAPPDGGVDTPPPPAVVQTASNQLFGSATISLALQPPSQAGDLLVVASGGWSPMSSITSITDNTGNTYVTSNATSNLSGIPNHDVVEIWYATNARGGATQVTIAATQTSNREAWLVEASGLLAVDQIATLNNAAGAMQPTAPPITPTVTPSLIVAVGDIAPTLDGVDPASPFTQLTVLDSNDAAWLLTAQPGTYAAVWDAQNADTYCVSVAAFR